MYNKENYTVTYPSGLFLVWPKNESYVWPPSEIDETDENEKVKRFIHWDFHVEAPISKIMNREEFEQYCDNIKTPEKSLSFWAEREEVLIGANKAGLNGENITWKEILELYK